MITSPVSGSLEINEGLGSRYGMTINPSTGKIYAPTNGVVEFARNHSIIIKNKDGFRIQIQVGEQIEKMDQFIHIKTQENTMVSRGELLAVFDRRKMLGKNIHTAIDISICNYQSNTEILKSTSRNLKVGDNLFVII